MKNLIKKILKEEFQGEKLWEVKMNMFDGDDDLDKYENMIEIYELLKDKKGFTGIKVHGNLDLDSTKMINELKYIVEVTGNLYLSFSDIKSLGQLETVHGRLYLHDTDIKSLGKLRWVGKTLYLQSTIMLEDLGDLKYVGGNLRLENSSLSIDNGDLRKKINIVGTYVDNEDKIY